MEVRRHVLLLLFSFSPTLAVLADPPETTTPFLPDVENQFADLAIRPEALAFRLGAGAPDPGQCKHYQGMARSTGEGTPYLFVSWSGNRPPIDPCLSLSDDPGALLIVELGTRDTDGERLRSNRFRRGVDIADTVPDAADGVVRTIRYDGVSGWPAYGHPGGMQMIGDVLVLALEAPYDAGDSQNLIQFINVSDPLDPVVISEFDPGVDDEFSAGLVGVTSVLKEDGECCRYVMLVAGGSGKNVKLYRSKSGDLASPDLTWEPLTSRTEGEIESCLGADWHTGAGDAHQMLNFVREGSQTGPLYLIGGRNDTPFPSGDDYIDLYRVGMDEYGNPSDCLLTHVRSTHVTSNPVVGGGDSANFAAASGTYISPSLELVIYAAEYSEHRAHLDSESLAPAIVRFGEWRHKRMVRPGSPTLRPSAVVSGPVTVEEGSVVTVTGRGQPPRTKAWLQLFEDDDLGSSLSLKDDWLVADYADWNKDDFNDFRKEDYSDDAGSWRWFAPVGCTIRVNDDDFESGGFPGTYTRRLYGTGQVEEEPDLNQVTNDAGKADMDDKITSMEFFPNCDDYYGAAIGLSWDLDGDGSFLEAQGDQVQFSAFDLDGPTTATIHARGEHPSDPSPLGVGSPVAADIHIVNVAPILEQVRLVDAVGLEVGTDIPFALEGLPYFLEGSFTDPGRPDTQSASVSWGDGVTDQSADFDLYSDAYGGATGQIRHAHVYSQPGSVNVRLSVADDDGGASQFDFPVDVVDATAALGSAADLLEALVGDATEAEVRQLLEWALARIIGEVEGDADGGSVDLLDREALAAALTKISASLSYVISAEVAGAVDLTTLKAMLAVSARALAYQAYDLAVDSGIPAATRTMIETQLAVGDAAMAAGDYAAAVSAYKAAVRLSV